jgi:serine protease
MRKSTIIIGAFIGSSLVACTADESTTESESSAASSAAGSMSRVYVQYKTNQKQAVMAALGAAHATVHYELDTIAAVAASIPTAALKGIESNPNVALVEEDPKREPYAAAPGESPPYGVGMVGALTMQAAGYNGSGVKVCIIDSGLRVQSGIPTANAVTYVSGNLPANQDGFGHGTHVAGTIAGQPYTIGVAPGAETSTSRLACEKEAWALVESTAATETTES